MPLWFVILKSAIMGMVLDPLKYGKPQSPQIGMPGYTAAWAVTASLSIIKGSTLGRDGAIFLINPESCDS